MTFSNVLILGANGMLGRDLAVVFPEARLCGHKDLDITDEAAVEAYILGAKPDLVINAAAYTNVDGCEDEPETAFAVNGDAPGYIAAACREAGARLVHYSTDYVFDGSKTEYIESDDDEPDLTSTAPRSSAVSRALRGTRTTTGSSGPPGSSAGTGRISSKRSGTSRRRTKLSGW